MSVDGTRAKPGTLSATSRTLTRGVALLFMLLGLVMFFAPDWVSANFLWKVSPFVAMTMGAWYIGGSIVAWEAARVWRWSSVYPCMILVWLFSLLEAGVLVVHNNLLRIDAVMGWPYLAVLIVAAAVALAGIVDWVRLRPAIRGEGEPLSPLLRVGIVVFTVGVFFIAIFPILGYGRGGTIFPEPLSLFTLHAFGVFYLSIALATLPLMWERSTAPVIVFARAGSAPLWVITAAALWNLDKFNFGEHPTQAIYLGVYLVVGVVTTIFLLRRLPRGRVADAAVAGTR
jgi:hypothetical protein